jgi:putative hydrolase
VSASLSFPRFLDLSYDACNTDLHVHTSQTDGVGSIHEVLERAANRGLRVIAFTEHVRRDTPWFGEFAQRIREAAQRVPQVRVLVGCEAKAMHTGDDNLDAGHDILDACDIVLGSVHRFPDGAGGLLNFAELDAPTMARTERDLALALVRAAPIDVLAHPFGMYQRRHGPYPADYMRELMDATIERGIAIEISSSYLRDFAGFMDLCAELNPYVSIGSDAHKLEDVGACRDRVVAHLSLA